MEFILELRIGVTSVLHLIDLIFICLLTFKRGTTMNNPVNTNSVKPHINYSRTRHVTVLRVF